MKELVEKELKINVFNMCCFLPQEKVGEFSGFDDKQLLQETERALGHLAGSHVTILVSHLIGLKIKIYMAPGDTLVMTSLIRSAARRSFGVPPSPNMLSKTRRGCASDGNGVVGDDHDRLFW